MNPRLRFSYLALLALLLSACVSPRVGPELSDFAEQAPQLGEAAPRFTLYDLEGREVSLDQFIGDKPIVLQLGSHTCPVYRYRHNAMVKLHDRYRDRAHFLLVYTLEAHPSGSHSPYREEEWLSAWNRIPGVLIPQHESLQERTMVAGMSKTILEVDYPYLVDDMDNAVWRAYGSAPSPAFVIDQRGDLALRQAWVDAGEIADTLDRLLADDLLADETP